MGIHRPVPDPLRQLHPKFNTPWVGILVFAVIACITLHPGQATFLGNMYAFGAMLSFTIAHGAVIRMRLTEPDRERPYRGPGTLWIAGSELPGFAVFGGIATALSLPS
jgi:basic amino acid/polyamine antiporter, APA family